VGDLPDRNPVQVRQALKDHLQTIRCVRCQASVALSLMPERSSMSGRVSSLQYMAEVVSLPLLQ
jgi:hypothetical protein